MKHIKQTIKIDVTQEDIDKATKRLKDKEGNLRWEREAEAAHSCPIGQAIRRATKVRKDDLMVDSDTVHIEGFCPTHMNKTFAKVVRTFDLTDKPVKPFSFTLKLVPDTTEQVW